MRYTIPFFLVLMMALDSVGQTNTYPSSGNVGIGTLSPAALLDVYNPTLPANTLGSISEIARLGGITPNSSKFKFLLNRNALDGAWENVSGRLTFVTDVSNQGYIEFNPLGSPWGVAFGSFQGEIMRLNANGNIGIGVSAPSEKLSVNGNIVSKKVIVTQSGWPDYVFSSNYTIPSLQEIADYIRAHHHLPDIPSAGEIEAKGVNVGEMVSLLLKKIEELTLYILDQQKQLLEQKEQLLLLEKGLSRKVR